MRVACGGPNSAAVKNGGPEADPPSGARDGGASRARPCLVLAYGLFLSPLHLQQFPDGGHHVAEVCHDDHGAKDG
jgi:hypothetical protein